MVGYTDELYRDWDNLFYQYESEVCMVKKSELLREIRKTTKLTYVDLALELGENERTLKRIDKLNLLHIEFKELLRGKKLKVSMAYQISNRSLEDQELLYRLFKDRIVRWKLEDYSKVLQRMEYIKKKDCNIQSKIIKD